MEFSITYWAMKLKESTSYGLQANMVFVPAISVGLKLKFAEEVAFYSPWAKEHLIKVVQS